jgi:hypothetical protein
VRVSTRLCGRTLATATRQSGDRVAIAAYLGSSPTSPRRMLTSPGGTTRRSLTPSQPAGEHPLGRWAAVGYRRPIGPRVGLRAGHVPRLTPGAATHAGGAVQLRRRCEPRLAASSSPSSTSALDLVFRSRNLCRHSTNSSGVCCVSRQEGEEVPGDLPQDADNLPRWQFGSRLGELGRQRYSQLFGLGDERGRQALAQGA